MTESDFKNIYAGLNKVGKLVWRFRDLGYNYNIGIYQISSGCTLSPYNRFFALLDVAENYMCIW